MTTSPVPLVPGSDSGPWREASVGDRIKEYIVANHLRPGDPLPTEHELSDRLKVSRSRVREAVKTLSALDIVEVRHGYGTYVGRMSLDALVQSLAFRSMLQPDDGQHVLADLIDIRELIETSLSSLIVARLTPDAAAAMRDITSAMRAKAVRGEEFQQEDRDFHRLLVETTGNALAVQLTGAFWDVHSMAGELLGPPVDLVETADAHVAILDAVDGGDPARVAEAIREHYIPVRRRMRHMLDAHAQAG
ncbi:MAG TPA: FadR/GntR family transcriptional regulator [Lapillicoccus sp.]|uniref:FadR/GntR family transcriptional regulator n=1 Tax=Lapillicoccus sp. TaxID=1909287 RepID=UPI002F945A1C